MREAENKPRLMALCIVYYIAQNNVLFLIIFYFIHLACKNWMLSRRSLMVQNVVADDMLSHIDFADDMLAHID